jgi:hypothetical protein
MVSTTLTSKTSKALLLSQLAALETSQSLLHAPEMPPDATTLTSTPTGPRDHQLSDIPQQTSQLPNMLTVPLEPNLVVMPKDSPVDAPVSWEAPKPASSVPCGTAAEATKRGDADVAGLLGVGTLLLEPSDPAAVPSAQPPAEHPARHFSHQYQLDHAGEPAIDATSSKLDSASSIPTRESIALQRLGVPAEPLAAVVSLTRASSLFIHERPGTNSVEASSGAEYFPIGSGCEGPVVTSAPLERMPMLEGLEDAMLQRVATGPAQDGWPSLPQDARSLCPSGGSYQRCAAAATRAVSSRAGGLGIQLSVDHAAPLELAATSAVDFAHARAVDTSGDGLRELPEYSAQARESDMAELEALVFQAEAVGRMIFSGQNAGPMDSGVTQGLPQGQVQMV